MLMVSSNDSYARGYRFNGSIFVNAVVRKNEKLFIERKFDSDVQCMAWDD